jgi:uncharacterized membrane protein
VNDSGSVRRWISAVRTRWTQWRGLAFVAVAGAAFAAVVSEILVVRYDAFETFAWDLGIFNQAFSTTVRGQGFFYYTADLPSGNGGHLLAAHFSPVLVALIPAYAAVPGPATLLVLQTVAVGFAAVPLYFFARAELRSESWAIFLALVCLASPVLLGILWYDFHAEAFLPLGIGATVATYRLGRHRLFLIAWFLTLAVIETAAPLLLVFGVLAVAGDYFVGRRPYLPRFRSVPLTLWVALGGAVAWLGVSGFLAPYLLGVSGSSGAYSATYAVNFQVLGATSIPGVIPTALTHPTAAYAALSFDAVHKATYVLLLLGSLGFLPLVGRLRYLLPGLVWPILAAFSNHGGYYSFGDQYAAYTLPFLMLAAIDGFARLRDRYGRGAAVEAGASDRTSPTAGEFARPVAGVHSWPARGRPSARRTVYTATLVALVAGLVVTNVLINPINPHPVDNLAIPHGLPTVTSHDQFLHSLVSMIPPQASVLTTQGLFPEVSSRPDAFVLPISSYFATPRTFLGVLDAYVNESDYLLYDITTDAYSAAIMQQYVNFSGFGVLAEGEGAVLYERGWTEAPRLWIPDTLNLTGGSLAIPPAHSVGKIGSFSGVLYYPGGSGNGTDLWEGPFAQLPPGTYQVTLTIRVNGTASAPGLQISVGAEPVLVSITPVEESPGGQDYAVTESYSPHTTSLAAENVSATPGSTPTNVALTGVWPAPARLNLTGTVLDSSDSVYLYQVSMVQVSVV